MKKIKRALISVSDKTELTQLCQTLRKFNVEIISTGGTLQHIQQADIPVRGIESLTEFPEMLEGRLKTLHPNVHGGILARRDNKDDMTQISEHKIQEIDLVVCNLYPFLETISREDCTPEEAVENIDIGGPTMIRSTAKNHAHTAVLCEISDYPKIIEELETNQGALSDSTRFYLARQAFNHTAAYDALIASWFNSNQNIALPEKLTVTFRKKQDLRYGENPHQQAAYYINELNPPKMEVLQGKELSYNNLLDLSGALDSAGSLPGPGVAIIKHTNPCGAAIGEDLLSAFQKARGCDPVSAFGGIIAVNGTVDEKLAEEITQNFVEIVAASEFTPGAREIFAAKKNLRLIKTAYFTDGYRQEYALRNIYGGLLLQEADSRKVHYIEDLEVKTKAKPSKEDLQGLLFAWSVVMNVKSNAIVFSNREQTLGIGAGQMSRVDSVEIAVMKAKNAGLSLEGSFLASDAFFPFRDSVDRAHEAGVRAIIQPGGSVRDEEVIAACDEHGIVMVFSGYRHFRH